MQQFAALLRKDSRPVRYLVVDDSVFARKNIIKMIEMFGGEVAGEAGDGLTAIAEFNRVKPDIALMDITMPQMTTAPRRTSCSWISPCHRWKGSRPSSASCASTPRREL